MKITVLALIVLSLASACSPQVVSLPTPAIPSPATTPTGAAAPSLTPTSAPVVVLSAPAVQQGFPLSDLPGVGRDPSAIALLGDKVYVLDATSDNVAVVLNNRVTKFIPVGKSPAALAADPAQNRLYVSNAGDKSVSLIVNDQVALTQNIGAAARALLFFENRLYVGLDTQDGILVLNPATLQTQTRISIPNIFTVINLVGDSSRHRVYANVYEKTAVIDAATLSLVSVFPDKGTYYAMVVNPTDSNLMLSVYDSATQSQFLTAFNVTTGAAGNRVKIGGDPYGAVSTADGSRMYVANSYTNNVTVIDPQKMSVIATVPVGMHPQGVALDEKARRLYVANSSSDSVSVVNTDSNQSVATIPVGMIPTALVANESTSRVYIANASTDSVFVVEGTRVVKEIPVGHHPIDLARDTASNRLFVANAADTTLSIIDESNFSVRATAPITPFLSTVAVDAAHGRVMANDVMLDLKTLSPVGQLTLQTGMFASTSTPDLIRVNPNNNRIYANGSNGVPGSNGRLVTYSIDGDTLKQRGVLNYAGNTTFFEIDPVTNRVYLAGTHPLASTSALRVFDANDNLVFSQSLPARTTGMVYNPQTHHLFLAHAPSSYNPYGQGATPADNTIQVFDTSTFGELAPLKLDSPGLMTRLGNIIYVVSDSDGSITLIQDVSMPAPPSPTATTTPSPYPTLPPATLPPARTASPTPRAATPLTCAISVPPQFAAHWTAEAQAHLGCPTEGAHNVVIAEQSFERGIMIWREDERRIYILYADQTWAVFDDTWTNAFPEDTCPSITVAAALVKPKHGFGKVWCDQSSARAKIGAASGAEQGASGVPAQRFARGQMFGGARGEVFVLYADNTWE